MTEIDGESDHEPEPLTADEIDILVGLLAKLPAGRQPLEVFLEIARIRTLPVLELVVLGSNEKRQDVLLTRRSKDDTIWPGLWHIPGVVLAAQDKTMEGALDRLINTEFEGLELGAAPVFAKTYLRCSARGSEQASIYLAHAVGKPLVGEFFNVYNLPEDIVTDHVSLIEELTP
jgi:hypothetical protein